MADSENQTAWEFDQTYDDGRGHTITVQTDAEHRTFARLKGKGTIEGTRAFIRMLDDNVRQMGHLGQTRALVSLAGLYSSPVRAQLMLGKWLFANKRVVASLAIYGGAAWEMKLARAVMKIARMKQVGFFDTEALARRYLGFEPAT